MDMTTKTAPTGQAATDRREAFPLYIHASDGTRPEYYCGMEMRDYFAAAALTGIYASYSNNDNIGSDESTAKTCYSMADAMMGARLK